MPNMRNHQNQEIAEKLVRGTVKGIAATVAGTWYLFGTDDKLGLTGRLADAADSIAWFFMIVGPLALLLLAVNTVQWIRMERDR